ncbi:MAG: metallophosphoesterase family protein [Fimbriimonas sp.]
MSFSRRELLASGSALGLSSLLPNFGAAKPRPFRFVHMTDFHIQPEMRANEGSIKAMRHAMSRRPKPNLVIGGGDLIMDSFAEDEDRTKVQWDLFTRMLKENCDVPFRPTLGNHDVWGWNKAASKTTGNEAKWGRNWFKDVFNLENTYYAFVMGGWKFIILDTIYQTPDGYNGLVDEAQFDWLKRELEATPSTQPILVVSHIPLFAPCTVLYAYDTKTGDWTVGGNMMTKNFNDIKKLIDVHPNVKVCISGHVHLLDRYEYNGTAYLCNGAVCGAWWKGKNDHFAPGYVAFELWPDGTWKHEFVEWGWKPE